MKYALRLLILILPGFAHGQSFTLPSKIIDSAYFEIRKGRSCDSLSRSQTVENNRLTAELVTQAKRIILIQTENEAQDFVIARQIDQVIQERDLSRLKND